MKINQSASRRDLLKFSLKATAALVTASALGSSLGCKKNQPSNDNQQSAKQSSHEIKPCQGLETLSESDKSARAALKYVDQTPIPSKTCQNCKVYTNPLKGANCGGCKVLPGPVQAKGYCVAWVPRM